MQFSTKIDGFEQKNLQGFENSYNSYEQYPLEKFFIFTIYQNYTLALNVTLILILILILHYPINQKPNHYPHSNSLLSEVSSQEQLSPEQMSDHQSPIWTLIPHSQIQLCG